MDFDGNLAFGDLVEAALREDLGGGDCTTNAIVDAAARCRALILAKEAGVLCGLPVARAVFERLSPEVQVVGLLPEGARLAGGRQPIAEVTGPTRAVLSGERLALNFLQRLSGIATLAAACVEAVRGTRAVILDTRKTTPGLRRLEKYAVRVGGGRNHRFGLFDGVLIKDNHIRAAGSIRRAVELVRRQVPPGMKVEVETTNRAQVEEALAAGAEIIMLDNMPPDQMRAMVALIAGRALVEASGGIRSSTLREVAETGVDFCSLGALTHSARALDISLDIMEER